MIAKPASLVSTPELIATELCGASGSEFASFIATLKILGIPHVLYAGSLPKEPWQERMERAGFGHITSLAAWKIAVGSVDFVFATGEADYEDESEAAVGPHGAFLFTYDNQTDQVSQRQLGGREQHGKGFSSTSRGLEALGAQYGFTPRH